MLGCATENPCEQGEIIMVAFFQSLEKTLTAGVGLLVLLMILVGLATGQFVRLGDPLWWAFFMRWLHVLSGVMWIGLLWYFNFVQTPTMPKIPDELKGGVSRFIAPEALFWFRWGAMSTIFFGLLLAILINYPQSLSYLLRAYTLDA